MRMHGVPFFAALATRSQRWNLSPNTSASKYCLTSKGRLEESALPTWNTPEWSNGAIVERHDRCHKLFGDDDLQIQEQFPDDHALYVTYEALFGVPRQLLQYNAAVLQRATHPRRWWKGAKEWELLGGGKKWEPHWGHAPSHIYTWTLPRGSDLFIKGLGTFDIDQVYRRLVERRWRRHKEEVLVIASRALRHIPELEDVPLQPLLSTTEYDEQFHNAMHKGLERYRQTRCGPGQNSEHGQAANMLQQRLLLGIVKDEKFAWGCEHQQLPYWYVSVTQLWVEAYFPELRGDTRDDAPLCIDHYKNLFVRPIRRFGEGLDFDRIQTSNHIATVLMSRGSYGREHFLKYVSDWKQRLEDIEELLPHLTENVLTNETILVLTPSQLIQRNVMLGSFPFLESLPEAPDMKVLRSPTALRSIGRELNNCAAKYCQKVKEQQCILVAHYQQGKPIALGEYGVAARCWKQIYLAGNAEATERVVQAYEAYAPAIERWARNYRPAVSIY